MTIISFMSAKWNAPKISDVDRLCSNRPGIKSHEHSWSEQTCRCKPFRDEFLAEAFTYSSPGDANSIVTGTHPTHRYIYEEPKRASAHPVHRRRYSWERSQIIRV